MQWSIYQSTRKPCKFMCLGQYCSGLLFTWKAGCIPYLLRLKALSHFEKSRSKQDFSSLLELLSSTLECSGCYWISCSHAIAEDWLFIGPGCPCSSHRLRSHFYIFQVLVIGIPGNQSKKVSRPSVVPEKKGPCFSSLPQQTTELKGVKNLLKTGPLYMQWHFGKT